MTTETGFANLVVECTQTIAKPASLVWQAVRGFGGDVAPTGNDQAISAEHPHDIVRMIKPDGMEIRVVEINDALMVLRTEMTVGWTVPWSAYQSRIRIEPAGGHSRATITCLAIPAAEPRIVEDVLRGLILLSLQSLKRQMDRP